MIGKPRKRFFSWCAIIFKLVLNNIQHFSTSHTQARLTLPYEMLACHLLQLLQFVIYLRLQETKGNLRN